jgi:dTMP kinase
MGKFIVFEGINGAGKDTLITSVAAAIRNQDSLGTVTMTGQPWPYEGWEYIFDEVMLPPSNKILDSLDNTGKAMLYCASRMHHIQKCIKPSLENFDWVLCSRWTPSTVIYQAPEPDKSTRTKAKDLDLLQRVANASRLGVETDYIFWINTPPELAAKRIAERGEILEFGQMGRLKSLHIAYEELFTQLENLNLAVQTLDGTKSIPDLTTEVIEVLKNLSTK